MPRFKRFKWDEWAEAGWQDYIDSPAELVAVDTETTGLGFYDEPFSIQLTWRGPNGALRSYYFEDGTFGFAAAILRSAPAWVFHNAKFDLQKLLLAEVIDQEMLEGREIHDTQTEYMLLDENGRKGLKDLAVRVLHYDDTVRVPYSDKRKKEFPEVAREVSREKYILDATRRKLGLTKDDGYHLLPREVLVPYALRDTEFTLQLHEILYPQLMQKTEKLRQLYRSEIDLQLVLLRMEADGFALDVPYVEEKASEYGAKVMEGWMELVELTGDSEFNPNSTPQVGAVLKKRGIKVQDTKEATLSGLDDKFARALLQYRADKKIHQTYLLALLREQRDGVIHPNFNPAGARTGRMSSSSAKE
jgi:DNA polymerase I-like protein with 3'-5' exonuclease and polymerase domains